MKALTKVLAKEKRISTLMQSHQIIIKLFMGI